MKYISLTEIKSHLARYIDSVKKGQQYLITDYGKPVAMITPIRDEISSQLLDEGTGILTEQIQNGLIRPALQGTSKLEKGELGKLGRDEAGLALKWLREEREGGW